MISAKDIKANAYSLGLINTRDSIDKLIKVAEEKNQTYTELISTIFTEELKYNVPQIWSVHQPVF